MCSDDPRMCSIKRWIREEVDLLHKKTVGYKESTMGADLDSSSQHPLSQVTHHARGPEVDLLHKKAVRYMESTMGAWSAADPSSLLHYSRA